MMREPCASLELARWSARLAGLRFDAIGTIEALFVSPRPDEHVAVSSLRVIPGVGIEGEYPGKQWWQGKRVPGRQISALSADVLDALEIPFHIPGDNLILRGFDLTTLEPGDILRVGDALLCVTPTPHRPCAKFAARTSDAKKEAIAAGRFRGVLLDARAPATIFLGDPVERMA